MGRDAASAAKNQTNIDNQRSNQLNDRANYVFGQVNPFLQGEMKNPQGFGPDLAKMNTASQQSLGGGVAAATGQGNLTAARTGNAGMYAPVIGEASRAAMRTNSENSLKTQTMNAMEKKREQTEGASGLMHEGDANLQASLAALGLTNGSLSAWNAADQNTLANWMGPLQLVIGGGQAAGSIMTGMHGCWIAEALWGADDSRTHLTRAWLNTEFVKSAFGKAVMFLYFAFGKKVAAMVKRSSLLRKAMEPLFDKALGHAMEWANVTR